MKSTPEGELRRAATELHGKLSDLEMNLYDLETGVITRQSMQYRSDPDLVSDGASPQVGNARR
jgi:hypothetical protein